MYTQLLDKEESDKAGLGWWGVHKGRLLDTLSLRSWWSVQKHTSLVVRNEGLKFGRNDTAKNNYI